MSVAFLLVLSSPKLVQSTHALLKPLLATDPELRTALHDISEHGTTKEDHVLPAWWIFDTNLEFLGENGSTPACQQHFGKTYVQTCGIAGENTCEVELLHFLLKTTWKPRVHA